LKGFRIKEAGGSGDRFYKSVMEDKESKSEKFEELRKLAAENANEFLKKLEDIRQNMCDSDESEKFLINYYDDLLRDDSKKDKSIKIDTSPVVNAITFVKKLAKEIFEKGEMGGTGTAPFCARTLGTPVFIYSHGKDSSINITAFDETGKTPDDNDLTEAIANSLGKSVIRIWHNGANHFQAIVPNNW
jgi:hypothetical protein